MDDTDSPKYKSYLSLPVGPDTINRSLDTGENLHRNVLEVDFSKSSKERAQLRREYTDVGGSRRLVTDREVLSGPRAIDDVTAQRDNEHSVQNACSQPTDGTFLSSTSSAPPLEEQLSDFIRERLNAALRPILEAYARSRGVFLEPVRLAIASSRPLTHPDVIHTLGGALRSKAVRDAIAVHADFSLLPRQLHAEFAKLAIQDSFDQPPEAIKTVFPDWSKPLVPAGQSHRVWHADDAAIWLGSFPPEGYLPSPLDVWDDITAAIWLNDRKTFLGQQTPPREKALATAMDAAHRWKPSLEVLDNLDELEQEELAYRVFVERFRRDVMPSYISERRISVRDEIELVTFGYQSLNCARHNIYKCDKHRNSYFDYLFIDNCEWIYDLSRKIISSYFWPEGFAESDLQHDFA